MPKHIREALGTAAPAGPGRVKLTLITPGQGSSGSYSAEVLEAAAKDRAFPRGTQMHVNHDTAMGAMERPEGDLRNLAGVLLEDAQWDGAALVAEARIGSAWRPFVEEFGEFIGVSIYAAAEIDDTGTVTRLVPDPFNRADLVTVAGRGGQITEVLEAARVIESRSIVATETTAHDVGMWLDAALRDRFAAPGQDQWDAPYSVDHDDAHVYYRQDGRYYRLAYTLTDATARLEGEPVEVHRRTEYDPVTPDPSSDPAEVQENGKRKGTTIMPKIEIDEQELAQLRESAGRVTALEDENKTLKDAAESAARQARQGKALEAVKRAFGKDDEDLPALYVTAAESAAGAEDYDHDKFVAMVNEAAAALASEQGAGTPSGVGETTAPVTESAPASRDWAAETITVLEGR